VEGALQTASIDYGVARLELEKHSARHGCERKN
jgi:hypothetical protein